MRRSRKNRQAQFQHVFTFIMLMIVAGVALLLGFYFVSNLLGKSCDASQVEFLISLKEDLRNYASYGTYQHVQLAPPCEAVHLCFVDASRYGDPVNDIYPGTNNPALFSTTNSIIDLAVRQPATPPSNVFVIDDDGITTPLQLFAAKVSLQDPTTPLCTPLRGGTFRLIFEGRGRSISISEDVS